MQFTWELSFARCIGAVHWGRYGRGLAMKLAKTHSGQPPLFMAYWLWAAVYLFVVVADAVAAGPGVPLNFFSAAFFFSAASCFLASAAIF